MRSLLWVTSDCRTPGGPSVDRRACCFQWRPAVPPTTPVRRGRSCGGSGCPRPSLNALGRRRGTRALVGGSRGVAGDLQVAAELPALLAALLVGVVEHAVSDLAPPEPERQRHRQRGRAEQRRIRDRHDLGGDLELVEDHERRDRHHQHGGDRPDDLAGRGVAHRALHEAGDRRGDRARDNEDQDGGDDVRQVRGDRADEVVQRLDPELGHGDYKCAEEDEPERERADDARRARVRRDPMDMTSSRAGVQGTVEPDLLEGLGDEALDDLGDDPTDGQDNEKAQEPGQEAEERVEGGLQRVPDVDGGGRCWHHERSFVLDEKADVHEPPRGRSRTCSPAIGRRGRFRDPRCPRLRDYPGPPRSQTHDLGQGIDTRRPSLVRAGNKLVVSTTDDPSAGSLRNAISNAMARITHEFYGKGPARTRTYIFDNLVFSVLDDVLTPVERALKQGGRDDLVRRTRLTFEDIMTRSFTGEVEKLTGARVVAYHSLMVFDPDMAVEIFVLDRPARARAPRRSDADVESAALAEPGEVGDADDLPAPDDDRPVLAARSETRGQDGQLRAAIANALVRLTREYWGKGPTRAKAYLEDQFVFALEPSPGR